MSMKLVALRIRVEKAIEARREAGQGSLEYIGAILVAGTVVGLVLAAAGKIDIGTALTNAVKKVTG
jgi:hypothetical protein